MTASAFCPHQGLVELGELISRACDHSLLIRAGEEKLWLLIEQVARGAIGPVERRSILNHSTFDGGDWVPQCMAGIRAAMMFSEAAKPGGEILKLRGPFPQGRYLLEEKGQKVQFFRIELRPSERISTVVREAARRYERSFAKARSAPVMDVDRALELMGASLAELRGR